MKIDSKTKRYLYCCAVILLAVLVLIIVWLASGSSDDGSAQDNRLLPAAEDVKVFYKEMDKLMETDKTISIGTVTDGLNDLGILITQEYYFTEVMNYSSVKKLFGADLKFTESSYVASYDGTVSAGVDFTKAGVTADAGQKKITVTLPPAEIYNVSVDPESFTLYSEKEGVGNRVSVTDFNRSLTELEKNARNKALEKGVLDKAEANAETVVKNFIAGLTENIGYDVEIIVQQ